VRKRERCPGTCARSLMYNASLGASGALGAEPGSRGEAPTHAGRMPTHKRARPALFRTVSHLSQRGGHCRTPVERALSLSFSLSRFRSSCFSRKSSRSPGESAGYDRCSDLATWTFGWKRERERETIHKKWRDFSRRTRDATTRCISESGVC